MLDLKEKQENAKKNIFSCCYDYELTLGKPLRLPNMSEVAAWQIHHINASASTPFDYYLQNMCFPFLDHLTEALNTRFDKHGLIIQKMYVFVPSVI